MKPEIMTSEQALVEMLIRDPDTSARAMSEATTLSGDFTFAIVETLAGLDAGYIRLILAALRGETGHSFCMDGCAIGSLEDEGTTVAEAPHA